VSVGTWCVGGGSWVNQNGGGGDGGGLWRNGVGSSRWADIGGGQDGAGNNSGGGGDSRVRADNRGRSLNNSCDTSIGVCSSWDGGGSSAADGCGLGQSDGGSWECVCPWGWADGYLGSWNWHNWDDCEGWGNWSGGGGCGWEDNCVQV